MFFSSFGFLVLQLNSKVPEFREVSGIEAGKKRIRVRTICDPFTSAPNYTYSPQICPKDAIPIGDFRNVCIVLLILFSLLL